MRPWQVERDRFGLMFSGRDLAVGEMVEVVPAARLEEAVDATLRQWVVAHDVKCGCDRPDTGGCDWPVPVSCTQAQLDAATGGGRP
jgi:hypothetical protein